MNTRHYFRPWLIAAGMATVLTAWGAPQILAATPSHRPKSSVRVNPAPQEDKTNTQNHHITGKSNRTRDKKVRSTPHPRTASIMKGQKLFAQQCSTCHGADGKGTARAVRLKAPSALLHTFSSRTQLRAYIETHMPADHPGHLTSSQSRHLADYLWSIAQAR